MQQHACTSSIVGYNSLSSSLSGLGSSLRMIRASSGEHLDLIADMRLCAVIVPGKLPAINDCKRLRLD